MIKTENIKRKFADESTQKLEKKVKGAKTEELQNQKKTELNDKDFQNTVKNIMLHPDRQKGIQLFKKAFLDDYSKEQLNEDFENHIMDLAYQIENGLGFLQQKFFKRINLFKQQIINKTLELLILIQKYNFRNQFENFDKNNYHLRLKVINSELPPSELITCDPKIFLSEENKQEFKKIQDEQIQSRNADWHRNFLRKTAKASMNICIRCKSKNIDTRLQQTRSADEPMTEFHQCLDCGRQWKC